ncbi:hypothetical protein M409DRAFT_57963 [Zasmidium cellare ATCC 36951]|uniref:Uncharacterized protein n=1 Tax=Zasmidium cellare ATCC 36951 TaxID=1080233 RepID=A0A6A6C7T6_ZASCE|nr:uncharacterized protein M409DRAFT_57963 [Zasmidium cellare ATCC 36951]KAF2162913.1 hypothetical protein M409DRAFT_57963 [Zasmidium cellare ATCC 36951]
MAAIVSGVEAHRTQCSIRHDRLGCSEDQGLLTIRLEGGTPEMASQIISTLQQAGRHIESTLAVAKTSKRQRKKQKAVLALVLHLPVGPLTPLNSWKTPGIDAGRRASALNLILKEHHRHVQNCCSAYVQAAVTGGADEKVASLIACLRLRIDHDQPTIATSDRPTDICEQCCSVFAHSPGRRCSTLYLPFIRQSEQYNFNGICAQIRTGMHSSTSCRQAPSRTTLVIFRLDQHELIKIEFPGIHNNGNATLCGNATLRGHLEKKEAPLDVFFMTCAPLIGIMAAFERISALDPTTNEQSFTDRLESANHISVNIKGNVIMPPQCHEGPRKPKDYTERPPDDQNLLVLDSAWAVVAHLYGTCPHATADEARQGSEVGEDPSSQQLVVYGMDPARSMSLVNDRGRNEGAVEACLYYGFSSP